MSIMQNLNILLPKLQMQTLKFHYPVFTRLSSNPRSFLSLFSTNSASRPSECSNKRTFVLDYLNSSFKFSKSQGIYVSKHVSQVRDPQTPFSVLNFFKNNGFSESQIHSMVLQNPQLLFTDVDRIMRPKIEFFQLVGLEGPELRRFISQDSNILCFSLKRTLVPSVEVVRKITCNGNDAACNERDFVQVLVKCGRPLQRYQRLVANVALLESCGIVRSQLLMLLKRHPRLFAAPEASLRNHVSRTVSIGVHKNSRMFVHALHTITCLSHKTFTRKLEFIQLCGFSKDETLQMFRRAPALFRTSENKLKAAIQFLLHTFMIPKSVMVRSPTVLMYSIEDRLVPRHRVLQLLISMKLLMKVPSIVYILKMSEKEFFDRYILRFRENVETLLVAYKGHSLDV